MRTAQNTLDLKQMVQIGSIPLPPKLHKSDSLVSWDTFQLRQIDEAKAKYIQAKNEGRKIVDLQGNELERFNANLGEFLILAQGLGETEFAFRIHDETGDRRIIWNARDPDQVKEAAELFAKHVKAGGRAYAIKKDGSRGQRIWGFDAENEEVIVDEKGGIREKLAGFAKQFKEVKLTPKTYPG